MITVSDINGVKQYTLHQFIKIFVLWVVAVVVLVLTVGMLLLYSLSDKVDELDFLTQDLQDTKKDLEQHNNELKDNISNKSEMLSSMNEQLLEIERIVGLEPDIESSFYDRANIAKSKTVQKVESSIVTVAGLAVLNRSIPTGIPVEYKKITDRFGYRMHPITKKRHLHSGIDFSADVGTPIFAPADGVVEFAGVKGTYGKFLLIDHSFGFKTAFGHLDNYAVQSGDYVSKGDLIGEVGNTGRSTGSHLHYEIRYLHKWLNPDKFLTWSAETYLDIMASERLVKWDELMSQIEKRLQTQTLNNTNTTRISYGNFQVKQK